jgi:hypothetical protein
MYKNWNLFARALYNVQKNLQFARESLALTWPKLYEILSYLLARKDTPEQGLEQLQVSLSK